ARGAQGDRRAPAARVAYRGRGADAGRAPRRAPGGRGPHEPRDRARALRDPQDRRGSPLARLRQARDRGPRATGRGPRGRKDQGAHPLAKNRRRRDPPATLIDPRRPGLMTTREAFERGTDTFNAHDIAGFAEVLADDVVFVA